MTGQQKAVLWIGLLLVGLNLVGRWSAIKSVIFSGAGITSGIGGSGSTPGIGSGVPGIPISPQFPLLGAQKTSKVTIM